MNYQHLNNRTQIPYKFLQFKSFKSQTFIFIFILQLCLLVPLSQGQLQIVPPKNQTIYDGVTKDRYVTYANLNGSQGIQISLPNQKLSTSLDYTVMMWFKPKILELTSIMYAFKFQSGFSCYFTLSQDIICENQEKCAKLQVDSSNLILNQWSHLTVSGTTFSNQGYLLLENNMNVISVDQGPYIVFKQYNTNWYICIGFCDNSFYFTGGIRDFLYISNYLNQDQVSRVKNNYMMWDQSIMAYFRFNENYFNKDEFRSNYAQLINGNENNMQTVDYISNDICYSIQDYDYLMHFVSDFPFQPYVFGGEFDDKGSGYEYGMSIWIYVEQNSCYAQNVTAGMSKCNIVSFNGVFTLYLSSNNSVKFIFAAKQDSEQIYSQDIFIPQEQWINIQMTMGQFIGFECRAYDILGRLVFIQNSTAYLYEQQSNSTLILLRNFRGYARYFQLFQKRQTLPILEASNYIVGSGCLIYSHFNVSNLNGLQLTNWARTKYYPRNFNMTTIPSFDYIDWPAGGFVYNSNQTGGLTSSPTSLFDGIACNDKFRTLQLNSANSRLHTTTPQFLYPIKSATVEFWFRAGNNVNQTEYLFQMWAYSTQHEYLAIHTDSNNYLFCAPFGIDTYRSPYVTYYDYTENNRLKYGWFHIVCSFQFVKNLVGYIYRDDLIGTYTSSISGIPNYLPADTYDIYIGNANANSGTGTGQLQLKELRLWASFRSYADIQKWRFNQLNPLTIANNTLLVYLRMTESAYDEYNFASVANSSISSSVDFVDISYVSDQSMLICPQSTYYLGQSCYLNPVSQFIATTYPFYNYTESQLYWIFSFEQSALISSNLLSELLIQWDVDDPLAANMTYSQRRNTKMLVTTSVFIDNFVYPMYLNVTNSDVTFGQIQEFMFVPQSCRFFIVNGNDSYSSFNNYSIPQGKQDIEFDIVLTTPSSYCANQPYYDQFIQNISHQISPSTNTTPNIQLVYKVQSSQSITVSVTIPAAEQSKFTTGVKYQLIFSFYWTNSKYSSQINPYQYKFQDLLYSLLFQLSPVTVVVKVKSNYPYALKGDTLSLDASQTYITSVPSSQSQQNLTFTWICPTTLTALCDGVITQTMNITFNQFLNLGGAFNQSYTFVVQVVWQDSFGKITFYYGYLYLSWYNIMSPSFTLTYPSPILYSASYQTFQITFNYYTPKNITTLDIEWQFTPNLTVPSYYNYTLNKTRLTIAQGGFLANTEYSLRVYVGNLIYPIANRAQTITFTTKTPPFGGTVSLIPAFGYEYVTPFQISLTGWQSANPPITYEVWSTDSPYGNNAQYLLTNGWLSVDTTFNFYANSTNPFLINIRDSSLEQSIQAVSAMIGMVSNTTSSSLSLSSSATSSQLNLVKAMNGEDGNMSKKYQLMLQLAKKLVSQENETQSNTTNIIYREVIINSIIKDIPLLSQNTNDQVPTIIKYSLSSLEQIINNTNYVNEDMMSNTLTILGNISASPQDAFLKQVQEDSDVVKNFANSLSHVLSYTNLQLKDSHSRRNLGSSLSILDIANQAITQVQAFLKQLCSSISDEEQRIKVETYNFQILVQSFSSDTNADLLTIEHNNASIEIQVQQLIQQLKELGQVGDQNLCFQSVFYNFNPLTLDSSNFSISQQSEEIVLFNMSLNGATNQEVQSLVNMNVNYYSKVYFQIDPIEYSNNQTLCMVYKSTIQDWSNTVCLTIVNDQQTEIQCICNIQTDERFYGVFKDSSRKVNVMILSTDSTNVEQSKAYLAVVIFVVIFGITGTAISISFDKGEKEYCEEQYIDLELDGDYQLSIKDATQKQFVQILKKLSSLTSLPFAHWIYKITTINSYLVPNKSLLFHLFMDVHPVFSFLTKYDHLNPRIIRFAFSQLQLSTFCLGSFFYFKHQNISSFNVNTLGSDEVTQIMIIGIIGSFLLISPISFLQRYLCSNPKQNNGSQSSNNDTFKATQNNSEKAPDMTLNRSEYNSSQQFNSISSRPMQNENSTVQFKDSGQIIYSSEQTEGDQCINQLSSKRYLEQQIASSESPNKKSTLIRNKDNLCLFILRLLLLILSYSSTLLLVILALIYSHQIPAVRQYCFVASFFIALFGNLIFVETIFLIMNAWLIPKLQDKNACKHFRFLLNHDCLTVASEIQLIRKAQKLVLQEEAQTRIKNHQMSLIMQNSTKNMRMLSLDNVSKAFGIQEILEENDLYEDSDEQEEYEGKTSKLEIKDLSHQSQDDNDLDTTENNHGIERIPESDQKYMFSPSENPRPLPFKNKSNNTSMIQKPQQEQDDNLNSSRYMNTSRQLNENA